MKKPIGIRIFDNRTGEMIINEETKNFEEASFGDGEGYVVDTYGGYLIHIVIEGKK